MDPAWRGFGIALAVSFGPTLLLILLALTGPFAVMFAFGIAPELAYLYPLSFAFKHSSWLGFVLTVIEFIGLAFVFGALTRYRRTGVQVLLAFAGLAVLWIIGRVIVAAFGLDLSFNVRM